MAFFFQKHHFDLISSCGTIFVLSYLYLGTRVGKSRVFRAEIYHTDGTSEFYQKDISEKDSFVSDPQKTEIRMNFPENQLVAVFEHQEKEWTIQKPFPFQGVEWNILSPRCIGSLSWKKNTAIRDFQGIGYADWLSMDTSPQTLGILFQHWGRIHLEKQTFVFNFLTFSENKTWDYLLQLSPTVQQEHTGFSVFEEKAPDCFGFRIPQASAFLLCFPERKLQEGSIWTPESFPRFTKRTAAKLITGDVRMARFLSNAQFYQESGKAFHEKVRFDNQLKFF